MYSVFSHILISVFAGFEEREAEVTVDVIVGNDVALECAYNEGSIPTPKIQWIQCSVCDGNDDTVLEDSMGITSPRYLDDGRYLFLDVTNDVLTPKYSCIVTNREEFQTARAPTTYTLHEGEHYSCMGSVQYMCVILCVVCCCFSDII